MNHLKKIEDSAPYWHGYLAGNIIKIFFDTLDTP